MTVRRWPLGVGILALLVSGLTNASASAQPAPDPPPAASPDARNASAPGPTWLATRSPPAMATAPRADTSAVSWRSGVVLLLLAALAGGTIYLRRRRAGVQRVPDASLRVLGSTRVGPKAYAVATAVGNRVLLLGVTDSSVRSLAWLDEARPSEEEPKAPERTPATHETSASEAGLPHRFRGLLRSALGRPAADPSPDAAMQIAAQTHDLVERSATRTPPERIEGQAAGLAARMQG